jgi:hypothetical protein
MSSDPSPSRRLVLLCRVLQGATVLFAFLLMLMVVSTQAGDDLIDEYWTELSEAARAVVVFSDFKRALLQGLALLPLLGHLLVLAGMWNVFGAFARGPVISLGSVRTLRLLGFLLLARAVLNILIHPLMLLAMTYDSPAGHRVLSVNLSSGHLFDVLSGVMFILIGHVLMRAVAIAEENRQFV